MATYGQAVLMGILEGLTEFIPVSSTGHLILLGDYLKFDASLKDTFSIAIQLGAILAVCFLYPHVFVPLLNPKNWRSKTSLNLLVGTLPFLAVGFCLYSFIKLYLFSSQTVAIGLIIGGIGLILVDKWPRKKTETTVPAEDEIRSFSIETMSYQKAFLVGSSQCLALWPGMSRSGSSIIGGMCCGLTQNQAAQFSFILAVPAMMAAVGYELLKVGNTLTQNDINLLLVGTIVSFVVAILAIKLFLKLLAKVRLMPFGVYRIIVGMMILL